jgi:hypothetical protein
MNFAGVGGLSGLGGGGGAARRCAWSRRACGAIPASGI